MSLVIGGRSKIGKALIEELVSKEHHVRGLIGSGETGDAFPQGVEPSLATRACCVPP